MKISIKTSVGNGWTYDFDIDSSIKIQELKKRLSKKAGDLNLQTMCLVFDDEQLDDNDVVLDFDIEDGSVLELINPNAYYRGLGGFFGLKFVDVSVDQGLKRIQWSKKASRWRRARHGLCLEGQCTNAQCEAHGQTVIMPIGYKKFDMLIDPNETTTKCPACNRYVRPETCAFNNCWWRYDGTKDSENGPPQICSSDWKRADDAYHRFDEQQSGIITWRRLVFEAVRRLPSEIFEDAPVGSVEPETSVRESEILTSSLSSSATVASIPPQHSRRPRNQDETNVNWFGQPDTFWCPWDRNSCRNKLTIKGQGTISIMQNISIPFELRLSSSDNPHDQSAYTITLTVDSTKVQMSTSNGQSYESTDSLHTLQLDDKGWHRYWISFYGENRNIIFGIGEIRPFFAVFNINLPDNEEQSLKELEYLFIKLNNNDQMLTELDNFKDNFRFYLGKEPIVYDPPLFVIPENVYLPKHDIEHTAIPPSQLEKPCRDLYDAIINFKLDDNDFPNLTDIIDESIKNPQGWCYRKLREKANRFGKPNLKTTYLRLTLGNREGNAPGHKYVIEIWPAGHFSPIHSHSNAYAIIKVLYGEILLKLYPALRLNVNQYQPIEQICHQGQITWLLPDLNQTHQLKHVDLYGTCCITIQCYKYGMEDRRHYEYFDYLPNEGGVIKHFEPKSDIDYHRFIERMQQERRHIYDTGLF